MTLSCESKLPEAHALAEEAYILASKHFSPAHKTVLKASVRLINCLIVLDDCSTADTYCRMNYSNLFDPMNAEEYDVEDKLCVMGLLVQIWLKKEPDEDEIVEKALADEAFDLSRRIYALIKGSSPGKCGTDFLSILCRALLKGNQLTEETEGLIHLHFTICIAQYNYTNTTIRDSLEYLSKFYLKLHESFPLGEESILVKENIELCQRRLLELESCDDSSLGYITGSQKIKPYFKNNVELEI